MEPITVDQKIEEYLGQFNLDLRVTHFGRFMDQKLTPDVLSFIADCILNYTSDNVNVEFTVHDIWDSQYFSKNVKLLFGKPDADNETVIHEYDKFIGQPIQTLRYANVLSVVGKKKTAVSYRVNNLELLEYISLKEKYSLNFLRIYLTKVFSDSGFKNYVDEFIRNCQSGQIDEMKFQELKRNFQKFIIGNTKINTPIEVNRIFTKVINVFSATNYIKGAVKGRLSDFPINFTDLMYNRINFRDADKLKGISRQEAASTVLPVETSGYNNYLIEKAKQKIKAKYSQSEVKDAYSSESADYVHHIFPMGEFPSLATFLENLIKLTATQHFTKAHPKGNTFLVDKDYQIVCLLCKSVSIESSLAKGEFIYSKPSFTYVLSTGLKLADNEFSPNMDFSQIRDKLAKIYKYS